MALIGAFALDGGYRGIPSAVELPPTRQHYARYSVALVADFVASPGDVCTPSDACALGSGGGLAVRAGYRGRDDWYVGGAYEFARMDSENLLRLGILQQVRGEALRYLGRGRRLSPYLSMVAGLAVYGNEWSAATVGAVLGSGVGFDYEVSPFTLVGVGLSYRPLLLAQWQDSGGNVFAAGPGGFGVAHVVALELTVALQSPLSRW